MKYSVIDIGSNSMRLTVYSLSKDSFTILFKEKIMAGLAGYTRDGVLLPEGIQRACSGLSSFRHTLQQLEITGISAFATASLRNIQNTDQAADALSQSLGQPIEILSGEDEARYGYLGAMEDLSLDSGLFVDIGGASTELVQFSQGNLRSAVSLPVGSLKLYRDCVKRILPGDGSRRRIRAQLHREFDSMAGSFQPCRQIAGVGGTARAALKLARSVFHLPEACRTVPAPQLEELYQLLRPADKRAIDLILRVAPERIHTLMPGLMILRHIVRAYQAEEIIVSSYGVREGFLCQRIQSKL